MQILKVQSQKPIFSRAPSGKIKMQNKTSTGLINRRILYLFRFIFLIWIKSEGAHYFRIYNTSFKKEIDGAQKIKLKWVRRGQEGAQFFGEPHLYRAIGNISIVPTLGLRYATESNYTIRLGV